MEYLILCIGNREGGDDAVGPFVADKLKKCNCKDTFILDCGTIPENYTSIVKKHDPKNLVIIDCVEMGLNPGEIRIVPKEKIGVMHISTHGIPLSVFIGYLEQYLKNIILIGVQPKNITGAMSKEVRKSCKELVKILKNKNFDQIKILK
jgi:hydrogenase 3 maturation protease